MKSVSPENRFGLFYIRVCVSEKNQSHTLIISIVSAHAASHSDAPNSIELRVRKGMTLTSVELPHLIMTVKSPVYVRYKLVDVAAGVTTKSYVLFSDANEKSQIGTITEEEFLKNLKPKRGGRETRTD